MKPSLPAPLKSALFAALAMLTGSACLILAAGPAQAQPVGGFALSPSAYSPGSI